MTFLITGGAGFIGSNFLLYTVNKYPNDKYICLDSLTYAGNYSNLFSILDKHNFKFIKGSINDNELLNKIFKDNDIDVVINFAAETHVDNSINNPDVFVTTNVNGTLNLLEQARKNKVKKYYQISTDEVYGDLELNDFNKFDEASLLRPSSPYSASKASADLLVLAYKKTYNLPILISRCSNNYGPYQFPEKLIPKVIEKALNNEEIPVYGNGSNIRDWIYVKDHVIAIDKIARYGKLGEIYNVSGNCEISNLEVVKTILKYLNKSADLITFVDDRLGHDKKYSIDSNKIVKDLSFENTMNFQEGILKTIDWYLDNKQWLESIQTGKYREYYDEKGVID